MARLRRVSPIDPGYTRRRAGRGWVYADERGRRITDRETIDRIAHLAIPPAYREVWICRYPNGHIQAVGTDDRGRRQYRYHPDWREQRDRAKHDRVLWIARRLPRSRERVTADLALPGLPRERVLAAAFRLLELGFFRVGGESYAEENGSYGLATLRREHVTVRPHEIRFHYLAKSGKDRDIVLSDPAVRECVAKLKRRRGGGDDLLAWRQHHRWHDVTSADINTYLHEVVGDGVTAKDFRTWHGTVIAAAAFAAVHEEGLSATKRKRTVTRVMREVADQLGNTPAVARKSYVDPRVVERFDDDRTVASTLRLLDPDPGAWDDAAHARLERAVIRLLGAGQRAARAAEEAEAADERARTAQDEARRAGRRRDRAETAVAAAVEQVAESAA